MAEEFSLMQEKNFKDLSWAEKKEFMDDLCEKAKEQSLSPDDLLDRFYFMCDDDAFFVGMQAWVMPLFDKITENFSSNRFQKELSKLIGIMEKNNRKPKYLTTLSKKDRSQRRFFIYVDCFDKSIRHFLEKGEDLSSIDCPYYKFISLAQNKEQYDYVMQKLETLSQKRQKETYSDLKYCYKEALPVRPFIWNTIITKYNPEHLSALYSNIEAVADVVVKEGDTKKGQECLQVIIQKLFDPKSKNTPNALSYAYEALSRLQQNPQLKQVVDATLKKAVELPDNDGISKRFAYNQLQMYDELKSHVIIGQRIEKTPENPHGFRHVDNVPYDKPAVLFFGGTGSDDDRAANGYLSKIEKILDAEKYNIKDPVGLYGIIHDFGRHYPKFEIDADAARHLLFADHNVPTEANYKKKDAKYQNRWDKGLSEDTLNPKYIDELFNKAFLYRICDEKGNKLPVEEASKRIRNLTVCAHCHGAYTFLKIEEKIQKKMKEIGYSNEECAKIQKQLLCVACAPDVPLGISKSTMISFVSADDCKLSFDNNFSKIARENKDKIYASYLPGKKGEFFITGKIYTPFDDGEPKNPDVEHSFFTQLEWNRLTDSGKYLSLFQSNAIANGVKSSIEGTPLPSVEQLICNDDERCKTAFNKMKENGEKVWNSIHQKSLENGRKRYQEKALADKGR